MTYGVTSTGFVIKTEAEIQDSFEALFKAAYGDTLDLSAQSDFGQCVGVGTILMSEMWQQLQETYDGSDVNNAAGEQAEVLAHLTGTFRDPATFTRVSVYCCGTPATSLTTDAKMSLADSHTVFQSNESASVTFATATAHATSTGYVIGDIRTLDSMILYCSIAGTSAGSPPTVGDVGDTVVDNTVTWTVIGEGTGYVLMEFEALTEGPIPAYAGQATRIETAVSGWLSVYNLTDHSYLGTDISTDAELFNKREDELSASGSGTVAALQADLEALDGVTDAYVIENDTPATDGYGIPANSIMALVQGGDSSEIAETIYLGKGGGTGTYGSSSDTYTDAKGVVHTVYYQVPTPVNIYIIVNVVVTSSFPSDGDAQLKALLVAWGDANLGTGSSVVASKLESECWDVEGFTEIECLIGTSSPPTLRTTITTTITQIPDLDTSRITVNHV